MFETPEERSLHYWPNSWNSIKNCYFFFLFNYLNLKCRETSFSGILFLFVYLHTNTHNPRNGRLKKFVVVLILYVFSKGKLIRFWAFYLHNLRFKKCRKPVKKSNCLSSLNFVFC